MNPTLQDLTRGPLKKQIFLFSLPLIASNVLQVLFNMSDIAVVGRFAGAAALGAVGSTTTLVTLFTGFLIGLSGGVNVLVAQHFGAKNEAEVRKTVHTAFLVSAAAGLLRRSSSLPTWTLTRKFTPEFMPSKIRFDSERLPISSQMII